MDNFFSFDFTEGRINLPPEAIGPLGPIASRGGSISLILRNFMVIATCDFQGGAGSGPPVPRPVPSLDPPMYQNDDQTLVDMYFSEKKRHLLKEHENTTNSHGRNKKRIAICFLFIIIQHCRLQQNKLKHTR